MEKSFLTQESAEQPSLSEFRGTLDQIHLREDYVIVSWVPQYQTKSGIHLPLTDSLPYSIGIVERVGTGTYDKKRHFIPTTVKVGDKVWLEKWDWHQRLKIGSVLYAVIREGSIVAIIPPNDMGVTV